MKFRDDESQPVVSSLLRQGFLPDYEEALEEIDKSEEASKLDALLAVAGVGVGLLSSCGIIALASSITVVIPASAVLGCAIAAWNSRSTELSRESEGDFLRDFPQVIDLIAAKDKQGVTEGRIASAYNQAFKAYRYGEIEDLLKRFEGTAKNSVLRDIPDDNPAKATSSREKKATTKKQIGDHLFASLTQKQKAEVAEIAKQSPRKAIDHMMALHGITPDELEAELPGSKAALGIDATPKPANDKTQQIDLTTPVVTQSTEVLTPITSATQLELLAPSGIDSLTSEPFQSLAVIGGQRSGKTYLLSLISANLKNRIGTKVIYVNLYDPNGDAADDWGHADICITGHLRKLGEMKAKELIEKTNRVLEKFLHDTNAIVVFDEWVAFTHISNAWSKKVSQEIQQAKMMSSPGDYVEPEGIGHSATALMNTVCAIAGELSTIGKKQLKAIHLLSPDFIAGNVEQQGKVMKSLRPVVVAIPPGRSITWKHPKQDISQVITFDAAGYENSYPNFPIPQPNTVPALPCDRMAFFNGQWFSLDDLSTIKVEPQRSTQPQQNEGDDPWEEAEAKPANQNPQDILAKLEAAGVSLQDISTLLKAIAPNV